MIFPRKMKFVLIKSTWCIEIILTVSFRPLLVRESRKASVLGVNYRVKRGDFKHMLKKSCFWMHPTALLAALSLSSNLILYHPNTGNLHHAFHDLYRMYRCCTTTPIPKWAKITSTIIMDKISFLDAPDCPTNHLFNVIQVNLVWHRESPPCISWSL